MTRTVRRLRPVVDRDAAARRGDEAAATRAELVEVAERLFTAHGYAATSLDAIVAGARVTKGALYHHFSGKQALFEAVHARVERAGADTIRAAVAGYDDPWESAVSGLRAFLAVVRQPSYSRIVVREGPAVLGHERHRDQEQHPVFACVTGIVRGLLGSGSADLEPTFARIFFGAMSAAGVAVATARTPELADAEAERVERAITQVLSGLRSLVDADPVGVTSRS